MSEAPSRRSGPPRRERSAPRHESGGADGDPEPFGDAWWRSLCAGAPAEMQPLLTQLGNHGRAFSALARHYAGAPQATPHSGTDVFAAALQALETAPGRTWGPLLAPWEHTFGVHPLGSPSAAMHPLAACEPARADATLESLARSAQAAARLLGEGGQRTAEPEETTRRWSEYATALAAYAALFDDTARDALARARRRTQAHARRGEVIDSPRALYELWLECAEAAYLEMLRSDRYARCYGALVNGLLALRQHTQKLTAGATRPPDPADTTEQAAPQRRAEALPRGETSAREAPEQGPPGGGAKHRGGASAGNDEPEHASPPGIRIDPERALAEMRVFGEQLAAGAAALRHARSASVATTPKEAVYRTDKIVLYRFRPPEERRVAVPLLIVYALANRHYVTDLQPDRSTIRGLLRAGVDVYLIDWGYPDAADSGLTLDDYINGYIDACVSWIRERHGVDAVNLLGICQGGTFSLCYGALHPERVRNLVTMVTPVDFHTPDDLLSRWLREVDVDLLVDTLGNIPGQFLNATFLKLRPLRVGGKQYLEMLGGLADAERARLFARMERWIHDSPDQAGEAFRQFAKDFYQRNALVHGKIALGERRVDLARIDMPLLNVYATEDHLVPPESSLALGRHVTSTDYSTMAFHGGHIGIYVSARAVREVPPAIGGWLRERSGAEPKSGKSAGEQRKGRRKPPRTPNSRTTKNTKEHRAAAKRRSR